MVKAKLSKSSLFAIGHPLYRALHHRQLVGRSIGLHVSLSVQHKLSRILCLRSFGSFTSDQPLPFWPDQITSLFILCAWRLFLSFTPPPFRILPCFICSAFYLHGYSCLHFLLRSIAGVAFLYGQLLPEKIACCIVTAIITKRLGIASLPGGTGIFIFQLWP